MLVVLIVETVGVAVVAAAVAVAASKQTTNSNGNSTNSNNYKINGTPLPTSASMRKMTTMIMITASTRLRTIKSAKAVHS